MSLDQPGSLVIARTAGWRLLHGRLAGLLLAATIAGLAYLLSIWLPLPAVLIGLILGMLLASLGTKAALEPGLTFSSRTVLRLGVALLGAQITFSQIADLGIVPVVIAVGGLTLSLVVGLALARRFGLSGEAAALTSAAVSICGASAALAISAILPKSKLAEQNVGTTIAAVTVIGSIGMVCYPMLARLAGMDGPAAGVFLGASLHEVVQAVGGGFAHSETAGEVAATVKLVRVACLAPVAMAIGWWYRRSGDGAAGELPPLLPGFIIGFLLLAAATSMGLVPTVAMAPLRDASRFCLLIAIVALGMRISLRQLLTSDRRLILAVFGQTIVIAAFAFGAVLFTLSG